MHIGILLNNALVVAEFCLKEFAGKVSKFCLVKVTVCRWKKLLNLQVGCCEGTTLKTCVV